MASGRPATVTLLISAPDTETVLASQLEIQRCEGIPVYRNLDAPQPSLSNSSSDIINNSIGVDASNISGNKNIDLI